MTADGLLDGVDATAYYNTNVAAGAVEHCTSPTLVVS